MKKILNTLTGQMVDEVIGKNGQPVFLNAREQMIADFNQRHCNALGYEVPMTSLTSVLKDISEQKYFKLPPANFMPVKVGEGAWSTNLLAFRSFITGGNFESGIVDTGSDTARQAKVDAGVDSLSINIYNWVKSQGWTLFDLQFAAKAGNWDLVTAKEEARKANWDLGIQKVAFLGLKGDSKAQGLLNMSGVNVNTTRITSSISATATSSPANFNTMIQGFLADYRTNCAHSAWPTHFTIPESDYLGLAAASSPTYPIKSILDLMLETFRTMTGNPNFKIQACAYGDKSVSGAATQVYALYNGADPKTLVMNIPVDYTNTLANSLDNFNFQNSGYGQFTGVLPLRSLEILYYQY